MPCQLAFKFFNFYYREVLYETLIQIGFTEKESEIYLELLKLGPQAVSVIARKVEINRTTVYSVLRTLQAKGVVSSFVKNRVRVFVANDPNMLVAYFDSKCRNFESRREDLLSKLVAFRTEMGNEYDLNRPVVGYFDGIVAMKGAFSNLMEAGEFLFAYIDPLVWVQASLEPCLNQLLEYSKMKLVVPRDNLSKSFCSDRDLEKVVYIERSSFRNFFANEIFVLKGQVYIFDFERQHAVMLEGESMVFTYKMIFDVIEGSCSAKGIKL